MIKKNGTLFIIAAPSGAGKTSLVKALVEKVENLNVSISHTTRPARPEEVDEEAYYFIDQEGFNEMVRQNRFLEHATVYGNYYGTSRDWVENALAEGQNIILEIDWQGAQQIRSMMRNSVGIFVLPPDYHSLHQRLINRHQDEPETISFRMETAKKEISHYKEFDYIVINDDFDEALSEIEAIITATNLGKCRQSAFYDDLVAQIMAQKD